MSAEYDDLVTTKGTTECAKYSAKAEEAVAKKVVVFKVKKVEVMEVVVEQAQ